MIGHVDGQIIPGFTLSGSGSLSVGVFAELVPSPTALPAAALGFFALTTRRRPA